MDYIDLLQHLKELQPKTPESAQFRATYPGTEDSNVPLDVVVVHEEWVEGKFFTSLKELKNKVALKSALTH